MDRRNFLKNSITGIIPNFDSHTYDDLLENKYLPVYSGLERYKGTWTEKQVSHLFRRTLFGFTKENINYAKNKSMDSLVAELLNDSAPQPLPPININPDDTMPIGETWVKEVHSKEFRINRERFNSIRSWWSLLMLKQGISIREKMTLFWHNHFATESIAYNIPYFGYYHHRLLREYSLGNFQTFVEKMAIDPAMLYYLDGFRNTNKAPNENFGREQLELFTIGKGPLIEEGNYTNYTESDVQEASRVLTGWTYKLVDDQYEVVFRVNNHDTGEKNFSGAFGNKVITNNGEDEYKDLIQMIFDEDETAKYISRKLYRWFVHYEIDDLVEKNMIEPMAKIFRDSNYEIIPVLEALLKSQHFYDKNIIGCMIKNPIDLIYGMYRHFGLKFIDESDESLEKTVAAYKNIASYGWNYAALIQLYLLDMPNVAGLPAYYQAPPFGRMWINSVTMPYRYVIGVAYCAKTLKNRPQDELVAYLDVFSHLEKYSEPSNPNSLVDEMVAFLFPIEITEKQKKYLKSALVPEGQKDSYWTDYWNAYINNPNNTTIKKEVEFKLMYLFIYALSMAEYQLS